MKLGGKLFAGPLAERLVDELTGLTAFGASKALGLDAGLAVGWRPALAANENSPVIPGRSRKSEADSSFYCLRELARGRQLIGRVSGPD